MDANQAQEFAALMRQANDIVRPSDADADQRQTEEFMAWAQSLNLRARIGRELDDDGHHVWRLEIDTGRGKLTRSMTEAGEWRVAVEDLGLA